MEGGSTVHGCPGATGKHHPGVHLLRVHMHLDHKKWYTFHEADEATLLRANSTYGVCGSSFCGAITTRGACGLLGMDDLQW